MAHPNVETCRRPWKDGGLGAAEAGNLIVRLGFFIKSERAKLFRDWAEELIVRLDNQPSVDLFGAVPARQLPASRPRKHNRLTQERLLSIMADVCQIDDKALRMSITTKLMEGNHHGTI